MYNGNDLHPVDSGCVKMADLWFIGFQAIQPTADAGDDQSVNEFDVVTLDGSNSSDHFGDAISYLWVQTQGSAFICFLQVLPFISCRPLTLGPNIKHVIVNPPKFLVLKY